MLIRKLSRDHVFSAANRSLLRELIRCKGKERDFNSLLGIVWSLFNPLVTIAILYCIFSARFGAGVNSYPLYLLVSTVCTAFFVTTTTQVIPVLARQRDILLNTTIPPESLMLSELAVPINRFLVEVALCIILSTFFGYFEWRHLVSLAGLLFSFFLLIVGTSLLLALAYCVVRDVFNVWSLVGRLLFFASPVFFTLHSISHWAQFLVYWLNPLTPFLICFQSIFLYPDRLSAAVYFHSILLGTIVGTVGIFVFLRCHSRLLESA